MDDLPGIPAFGKCRKRVLSAQATKSQEPRETPASSSGISSGKVVNVCSSYLQQMRDLLHQLFECGELTEDKQKGTNFKSNEEVKRDTSIEEKTTSVCERLLIDGVLCVL